MATRWLLLATFSFDSRTTRISKREVVHPSHTYEARLLNAGYLDRSISVPTGLYQGSDAVIRIAETDRELREFLSVETPLRRLFTVTLIPEGGSLAAYDAFGTFEVLDAEFINGECTIRGRDITWTWIDKRIPGLGNRTNFPWMADGINEVFIPILQGIGESLSPQSPSSQQGEVLLPHMGMTTAGSPPVSVDRWGLAQTPIVSVTVYRKGPTDGAFSLVTSGYVITEEPYTFNGIDYNISFLDFLTPQAEGTEIRVDWQGIDFRGGWFGLSEVGHTSPPAPIRNPVDFLINMLYALLSNETRQPRYNVQSFSDARDYFEQNLGGSPPTGSLCDWAITEPMTAREFIGKWCASFEADVFVNKAGELTVSVTSETDPNRPVFSDGPVFGESTDNSLILMNSARHRLANPHVNRLTYHFGRNHATGEWGATEAYNNTADQAALGGSLSPPTPEIVEDRLELWGVRDEDTATDTVLRRMEYLALGSYRIEFKAPLPEVLDDIELAKLIGVRNRWGLAPGGYWNAEFKTTGLTYHLDSLECTIHGILRVPMTVLAPEASARGGFWAVSQGMSAGNETFVRSTFDYDTRDWDTAIRHLFGGIVSSNSASQYTHCFILDGSNNVVGTIAIPPNVTGTERQWLPPTEWFPYTGAYAYKCRMGNFGSNGAGLPDIGPATWAPLIMDPELDPDTPITKVRLTYDIGGSNEEGPVSNADGGDEEDGTGYVSRAFDHSNEVVPQPDEFQLQPQRWCQFRRLDSKWASKVSDIRFETVHGWGGLGFGLDTSVAYIRLANDAAGATSVSDTFDRANQTHLGTSSSGYTWTYIEGTFGTARIDIVGNIASIICNAANAAYRLEVDMPGDDHLIEADIFSTSNGNVQGLIVRADDTDLTYYLAFVHRTNQEIHIYKRVTGTYTLIHTITGVTLSLSTLQRFRFEIEGSALRCYIDGVQQGTDHTDTSITTGLRVGVWGNSTLLTAGDGWLNDMVASDAVGSSGTPFSAVHITEQYSPDDPIEHYSTSGLDATMDDDTLYSCSIYRHSAASNIRAKAYKAQVQVCLTNLVSGDQYEQPYTICRNWEPSANGVMMNRRQAVDLTNAVAAYFDAWGSGNGNHEFFLWDAGTSKSGTSGSKISASTITFTGGASRSFQRSANILAQLTHGNFVGVSYETTGGTGDITGCAMLTIVREVP